MSSLRQLRREATAARKAARKSCALAFREARAIANVRAAMIKANELKLARAACERAHAAALALVNAYNNARPPETPARAKQRAKRRERRDFIKRDAIARVMSDHPNVPERVAELAVNRAERHVRDRPGGRGRWELIAERAQDYLNDAWIAYERESGPPGFVPRAGGRIVKKRARRRGASIQPVGQPVSVRKKRSKKKSAKRSRAPSSAAPMIVVVEDDEVPF